MESDDWNALSDAAVWLTSWHQVGNIIAQATGINL